MHARNYTVVIIGFVLLFATILYFLYARGKYTGPVEVLDAVRIRTQTTSYGADPEEAVKVGMETKVA